MPPPRARRKRGWSKVGLEGSRCQFDGHSLGDAVRAAILDAQQGRVTYPEFKRLSQRAGCIGYTVWLAGRHVCYLGRKGETHVERFPNR